MIVNKPDVVIEVGRADGCKGAQRPGSTSSAVMCRVFWFSLLPAPYECWELILRVQAMGTSVTIPI